MRTTRGGTRPARGPDGPYDLPVPDLEGVTRMAEERRDEAGVPLVAHPPAWWTRPGLWPRCVTRWNASPASVWRTSARATRRHRAGSPATTWTRSFRRTASMWPRPRCSSAVTVRTRSTSRRSRCCARWAAVRRTPPSPSPTTPSANTGCSRPARPGLGVTARPPDGRETWEGGEDSAVPPERLGDYLRDLKKLFDDFGYDHPSPYGHFGQGCVHTRIPFELTSAEGARSPPRPAAARCGAFAGARSPRPSYATRQQHTAHPRRQHALRTRQQTRSAHPPERSAPCR